MKIIAHRPPPPPPPPQPDPTFTLELSREELHDIVTLMELGNTIPPATAKQKTHRRCRYSNCVTYSRIPLLEGLANMLDAVERARS